MSSDWQCVDAPLSEHITELKRCISELRAEVDRLKQEHEQDRCAQRVRERARQERAEMFETSMREQAEMLRTVYDMHQQDHSVTSSTMITTPVDRRFPLINERLRNLRWRMPGTDVHIPLP